MDAAPHPGHCDGTLPLLDFQVRFALKFREKGRVLGNAVFILHEFDIVWDCPL